MGETTLAAAAKMPTQAATGDWTPDLFKYMEGKWQEQSASQLRVPALFPALHVSEHIWCQVPRASPHNAFCWLLDEPHSKQFGMDARLATLAGQRLAVPPCRAALHLL